MKLWDTASGQEVRILRGHTNWVQSVSFSPDGRLLASASDDGAVKLWDAGRQEVRMLRGHTSLVQDVSFSPDGRRVLARAPLGGKILAWPVKGGKPARATVKDGKWGWEGRSRPADGLLALPFGDAVLLVDMKPPSEGELRFRRLLTAPDPGHHEESARLADKDNDRFAAAFHQGRLALCHPAEPGRWQALASAYALLSPALALSLCDRLVAEQPKLAQAYFLRARLLANLFQFHEATADNLAGLAVSSASKLHKPQP